MLPPARPPEDLSTRSVPCPAALKTFRHSQGANGAQVWSMDPRTGLGRACRCGFSGRRSKALPRRPLGTTAARPFWAAQPPEDPLRRKTTNPPDRDLTPCPRGHHRGYGMVLWRSIHGTPLARVVPMGLRARRAGWWRIRSPDRTCWPGGCAVGGKGAQGCRCAGFHRCGPVSSLTDDGWSHLRRAHPAASLPGA